MWQKGVVANGGDQWKKQTEVSRRALVDINMRERGEEKWQKLNRQTNKKIQSMYKIIW
jgi:hypothetical protein